MPQLETISLRNAAGRILDRDCELSYILHNVGHFHLKRNKRGNITAAILKERASLALLTRAGESYRHALECGGIIWALRGTSGARPAPIVA